MLLNDQMRVRTSLSRRWWYGSISLVGALALSLSVLTLRAAQPEAIELLYRYQAGASRFQVYSSTVQSMTKREDTAIDAKPTWTRSMSEFIRDGNRIDERITEWRGLESRDEEVVPGTEFTRRVIANGELWLEHKTNRKSAEYVVISQKQEKYRFYVDTHLSVAYKAYPLDGILGADLESVATILRNAETLAVHKEQEDTDGSPRYVVEGSTPSGDYKLWIDPSKGYNIVQAESMKHEDHLYFGKRLGAPIPPPPSGLRFRGPIPTTRKQYSFRMYDVRCEQIDGVWIPMAASYDTRLEQVDGRVHTSTTHCKRLRIDLSPDFQALGAFVPDVPDGTPVSDLNTQERYVWEGGGFKLPADKEVGKLIRSSSL